MNLALIHYRVMRVAGGLESRLTSYLNEFVARGHEVTLISAQPRNLPLPEGVRLQRLPRGPVPKKFQQVVFNSFLSGWMNRHSYDLSISTMRTSHQDIVLIPGTHLGFLKAMDLPEGGWGDRAQIRLDRLAFSGSKKILAASHMMMQEACELYGVPEEKVEVLIPPTDTSRFKHQPDKRAEARKALGIKEDEIACAFISASHHRKGIDLLIETFKALTGQRFKLFVAGSPLTPRASALENVTFLGHLSNPEELYAACDLTLLPAIYEPYGQVVTESVLCGIPAFTSDRVGAGYYLTAEEGKVLPYDQPEAWIEAIRAFEPEAYNPGPDFLRRMKPGVSDHVERMLTTKLG